MILQTLHKIRDAEAGARKRVSDAKEEAVRMVDTAKLEAEKLVADKVKDVRLQTEKMREAALNKARKECRLIADEWQKKIEGLSGAAQKNLEKAKEFILRSLLG